MTRPENEFDAVAAKSRRTIIWVQIGEAVLIAAAGIGLVILLAIVFGQSHKIAEQQHQLALQGAAQVTEAHRVRSALCDSQFTIGTLSRPTQQATKFGVQFIEASRKAFVLLDCPGHIGSPPKELVVLGGKYGVAIRF